jgi:hypothetical protein
VWAGVGKLLSKRIDVLDEAGEARRIHAGLTPKSAELVGMPLEFFHDVGADVAAAQDRQYLEDGRDGSARAEFSRLVDMEQRLLIKEFDAEKRAHPLGKRLLELH